MRPFSSSFSFFILLLPSSSQHTGMLNGRDINPRYGVSECSFDRQGVLLAVCGSNGLLRVFDFDMCLAVMQVKGDKGEREEKEKGEREESERSKEQLQTRWGGSEATRERWEEFYGGSSSQQRYMLLVTTNYLL